MSNNVLKNININIKNIITKGCGTQKKCGIFKNCIILIVITFKLML